MAVALSRFGQYAEVAESELARMSTGFAKENGRIGSGNLQSRQVERVSWEMRCGTGKLGLEMLSRQKRML